MHCFPFSVTGMISAEVGFSAGAKKACTPKLKGLRSFWGLLVGFCAAITTHLGDRVPGRGWEGREVRALSSGLHVQAHEPAAAVQ